MNKIALEIQNILIEQSNTDKARWLENYVKHNIKSKGVGIPAIRKIIKDEVSDHNLLESGIEKQNIILDDLMGHSHTEEKIASIIFMQLYWNNIDVQKQMKVISNWFDKKWIFDWNVCDWLCVRVLTPLLDSYPKVTIKNLALWNRDDYFWKARASLVPFVQCKSITEHKDTILKFSKTLIKRDERFAKTSVGWVLREYSKYDVKFVRDFLSSYDKWITAEVNKNATKYFN